MAAGPGRRPSAAAYDEVFVQHLVDIEPLHARLPRGLAIRVARWVEKLSSEPATTDAWRRNRNLYSALLLQMLREDNLDEPFHQIPPAGPLPSLPTFLVRAAR